MASFDWFLTLIGTLRRNQRLDVASLFFCIKPNSAVRERDKHLPVRSKLCLGSSYLMGTKNIERPVPIPVIARHLGCFTEKPAKDGSHAFELQSPAGLTDIGALDRLSESLSKAPNLSIVEIARGAVTTRKPQVHWTRAFKEPG